MWYMVYNLRHMIYNIWCTTYKKISYGTWYTIFDVWCVCVCRMMYVTYTIWCDMMRHRNINVYYTCGFLDADASVRHNNLGSQSLQGKNWTSSSIFHPWQSRVKLLLRLALDLQSLQVHQDHGVFVDCPASWVHIAHKLPPPMSFSQSMNFANELFIVALKPTSPPKPHDFSNAKRHVCVMASACGASYAFTSSHGKALGSKTWRWHLGVQSPGGPGFLRMHSMGAFAQIEIVSRTFPPSGLKRRPPVGSAGVPRRAGALAWPRR